MHFPKPRGRPRKDAVWNYCTGKWDLIAPHRVQSCPPPYLCEARHCAIAKEAELKRKQDEALELERRLKEEAELKRKRDEENEIRKKEEARLNAPKAYAEQYLHLNCPVYYFDAFGNFQQLGRERVAKAAAVTATMKKAERPRKRRGYRRVTGPNEGLASGESEYLSE